MTKSSAVLRGVVHGKTIELEGARDEANANPGDAKLQRKLKLATLAVQRAQIQLGLAEKPESETDGTSALPRRR